MKNMSFLNFVILDGYIACQYKDNVESKNLYFNLKPAITPCNDLIAIALSTLCGRDKYQSIYFDFSLCQETIDKIADFCHSQVIAKEIIIQSNKISQKVENVLSFSGGFDSLSAKYLMPDNTKLVSMDFGGKFAREKEFFNQFNTYIVTTNLLETNLKHNSWSFMGIAAILFSDYLGIKYHTFGGILEASPNNLSALPVAAKNITFPPFSAAGMINAPYTIGITEIGTAMILFKYAPELIRSSLDSLAHNGETKKYRKQLITSIVAKRLNISYLFDKFDIPNHKLNFGKSFTDDFLIFYFLKYAGIEATNKIVLNIPEEVIQLSNELTLNFYERINPNFLENFPSELLPELLKKAAYAKVIPYTKQDWHELGLVTNLLSKYYDI